MESNWIIDNETFESKSLREVKEHIKDMPKSELIRSYRNGGYIYHNINGKSVGGIAFSVNKNGKVHFSQTVKEPF